MKKSITRLKLTIDTPGKKRLHKEIVSQPALISPYKKLAKLMIDGRDYEGAIKVLKLDARLHPDDKSILEDLSRAHIAAGKTKLAEKRLKEMIKGWPSSHAPYNIMIKMYRDTGKMEKAIQFLQGLPRKSPMKEISHEKLYTLLFVMGDHERGVENLRKAIRRFGKNFRRCKDLLLPPAGPRPKDDRGARLWREEPQALHLVSPELRVVAQDIRP